MRSWLPLIVLCLAGFLSGQAQAQPAKTARTVQDDLGLFSAEAKAKANAEIARIKQSFHKDLVIETTQPPKQPKDLDFNDKAAVRKFINEWAARKFKNEEVNGVMILFVHRNKLSEIVVEAGPETMKRGLFTSGNADDLRHKLDDKMKTDRDGALLYATNYVSDTMRHNGQPAVGATPPGKAPPVEHPIEAPANQPQISPIMKYVLIGLGILLVFWIISAIIRGFSSMGRGYGGGGGYGAGYGGYGPGYGGGGGFMHGFLGGLLGGAAGMWAYNHFFGPSTPSAWGGEHHAGGAIGQGEPTDVGAGEPYVSSGDYSEPDKGAVEEQDGGDVGGGGGGDWGGGGGDAGGGDAGGGGDWGGGGGGSDWGGGGGGGDFGGGGGGDWGGGGGGGGDW